MNYHRRLITFVILAILVLTGAQLSSAQQVLSGTIQANTNARATPNPKGQVRFSLPAGITVTLEARSRDSQWLLIRTPNGQRGWVRVRQVAVSGGIEALPFSDEGIGQTAPNPDQSSAAPPAPVPTTASARVASGAALARTPPMGWNSWNHFHCGIDENLIRSMSDQMIALGLKSVGYRYVIVDDCWQGKRDGNGSLTSDPLHFPGGMKTLGAYIHNAGLKFGIYSSRGATSCAGFTGSLGFEAQDAAAFADWGVDYVKYDGCPYDVGMEEGNRRHQTMAKAIRASGRPMIFSIVGGGYADWYPTMIQLNRTTGDGQDSWGVILTRFDENASYFNVAHPGFWNDPDSLEVGNGNMTLTEYQTQFSLWAISAAPLMISADLRKLSPETLGILTNGEVIAVDQDALGVQGHNIGAAGTGLQVWIKRLRGQGQWAAVLLNRTESASTISIDWKALSPEMHRANVRDLWAHRDLGYLSDGYSVLVQPHGVVMIKISRSG